MLITGITNAQECYPNCPEPVVFEFDDCGPIYGVANYDDIDFAAGSHTVTETLYQIADAFFIESGENINNYDVNIIYYNFNDNDTAGRANICGVNENGQHLVEVEINEAVWGTWNKLGIFWRDTHKLFLMYHELGHAVLNLDHVCTRGEIMVNLNCSNLFGNYNDAPVENREEFREAAVRMFTGVGQQYISCESGKRSRTIEDIIPN